MSDALVANGKLKTLDDPVAVSRVIEKAYAFQRTSIPQAPLQIQQPSSSRLVAKKQPPTMAKAVIVLLNNDNILYKYMQ